MVLKMFLYNIVIYYHSLNYFNFYNWCKVLKDCIVSLFSIYIDMQNYMALKSDLKIFFHSYYISEALYSFNIVYKYIYGALFMKWSTPPKKSFPIMLKFLQIVALSKVKSLPKVFGWQLMDSLLTWGLNFYHLDHCV